MLGLEQRPYIYCQCFRYCKALFIFYDHITRNRTVCVEMEPFVLSVFVEDTVVFVVRRQQIFPSPTDAALADVLLFPRVELAFMNLKGLAVSRQK